MSTSSLSNSPRVQLAARWGRLVALLTLSLWSMACPDTGGQGPNPQELCTPGESSCSATGQVQVCKADGSGFESSACSGELSCQVLQGQATCAPAECTRNKRFCVGDKVLDCGSDNAPSRVYLDCGELDGDRTCVVTSGVATCGPRPAMGECSPGAKRCVQGADAVEVCKADGSGFEAGQTCDPAQQCQAQGDGSAGCVPRQTSCTSGESSCSATGQVQVCKADGSGFESSACSGELSCQVLQGQATCAPAECTRNRRFCADNKVLDCGSNSTPSRVYQDCGLQSTCSISSGVTTCLAGPPEPCMPGQRRCGGDGKSIQSCRMDGTGYSTDQACSGDDTCQDVQGTLRCASEQCMPGALRCSPDGMMRQQCNDLGTGWRGLNTCGLQQSCQVLGGQVVCASTTNCTPNENFCQNNELWSCDELGKPKTRLQSCGTGTCGMVLGVLACIRPDGPCTPGATRCLPPSTSGTARREQCLANGTGYSTLPSCRATEPSCAQLTPEEAVCEAFSCSLGAQRCSADGKGIERCRSDRMGYEVIQACAADALCLFKNGTQVCASQVCVPGSVVCQGGALYACRADGTGLSFVQGCGSTRDCVTDEATGQGACVPRQICTPGESRCHGSVNRIDVCRADGTGFDAQMSCAAPATCQVSASGQPVCQTPPLVCSPGTTFCDGAQLRSCSATGLSSTFIARCDASGGQCAQSESGARCVAPVAQTCTPGQRQCSSSADRILECKADGTGFHTLTSCASGTSCASQNGALVCAPPPGLCVALSTFCEGDIVRSCNVAGTSSSAIQRCDQSGRRCVEVEGAARCEAPPMQACSPGEVKCSASGERVEMCRADGSGFDVQSSCPSGQRCGLTAGQPACQASAQLCAPSSSFCQGDDVRACNASGTGSALVQSCAATSRACVVINGAATCYSPPTQVCSPGERRCSADSIQVRVCRADGSGFDVQSSCPSGQVCGASGGQVACEAVAQVCAPASSFCQGDDVRVCNASGTSSALVQRCATNGRQCVVGSSGAFCYAPPMFACEAGERRCSSDALRVEVCKADRSGFEAQTTCAAAQTCQAVNGQPACAPDPGVICTPNERSCQGSDVIACSANGRSTYVVQRCASSGGRTCVIEQGAPVCRQPVVSCQPGYRYNGVDCVDINECADGSALCEAVCTNTPGSYTCTSSVSDASSPYWSRSCTLSQQLMAPTALVADCRCNTNKALTGGLPICWRPYEAFSRWPSPFGPGVRPGAHPQASIYGGHFDAASREIVAVVHWSSASEPNAGFVMAFHADTGARRVVSGRYLDPASGVREVGMGHALSLVRDVQRGPDGKLYVLQGSLQGAEIVRVEPTTGARALVWRRDDAAFGQCPNGRGGASVQTTAEGFVLDAQGRFYLAFTNTSPVGEGVGVIRVSADGSQCAFVTRSGSLGTNQYVNQPVGGGWTITSGNLRGFAIHQGELFALNNFDMTLYAIELSSGDRRRVSSSATSNLLGAGPTGSGGMGQRWVTWDATRHVFWTSGRQGGTKLVLVEPGSGARHDLDCASTTSTFAGVGCIKGALDTGLSLNFGGFWLDPGVADRAYFAHDSLGIVTLEISTGNSINRSL